MLRTTSSDSETDTQHPNNTQPPQPHPRNLGTRTSSMTSTPSLLIVLISLTGSLALAASPTYQFSGVALDYSPPSETWTECFSSSFNNEKVETVAALKKACCTEELLFGCRLNGDAMLKVSAPRAGPPCSPTRAAATMVS